MVQKERYFIDWVVVAIIAAILFVLLWAAFVNTAHADTLVLCKPVHGSALRVRATCTKSEVQLDPVALGLQGPAGPQGQKGDKGDQGPIGSDAQVPHLFDGNGQDLGVLIEAEPDQTLQFFRTYLKEQGVFIPVELNSTTRQVYLIAGQYGGVFFEGPDCSGNAFSRNNSYSITSNLLVYGVVGYFKYSGGEPATRSSLSYAQGGSCHNTSTENSIGYPLESVVLPFAELLTYPLHVSLVP